jgi:cytochrome P450
MGGIIEFLADPGFLVWPPLLFLVGNAVIFVLSTLRPKAFPPGPRGFPAFGNLYQIDRAFPFLTYASWAKSYGKDTPLGIKKGSTNQVVLNSGHLVRELVEKRGAVYSDRPWQFMNNTWVFVNGLRPIAIFNNYSSWLTKWRKEFNNSFGSAAVARLRPVYEAESARLLVKLMENPTAKGMDMEAILACWMISVPCLGACGRRPDTLGDYGFSIREFRDISDEYAALVAPNAMDLFPVLRYLPEFFGMAEWKNKARTVREKVLETGTKFVGAAREQRAALDAGKAIAWESVVAKMLKEQHEKNDTTFSLVDMGNAAFHIVSAATNTSSATMTIILMTLAKYPDIQQKVVDEVLEISGGAIPTATDIANMKYMDAFWNEVKLYSNSFVFRTLILRL